MKLIPLLLLLIFILVSCSGLFYQNTQQTYSDPKRFKLKYSDFNLTTKDNVRLHGWHIKNSLQPKDPESLVLFFHGNAQNITAHYLALAWMTQFGHDLMIFDYRGYGKSESSPDQKGTYLDALAFLKYGAEQFSKGNYKRLIVIAQSLGGIIALRALEDFPEQKKIDLLVLDSTFTSYQDLAFDRAASLWFTFIFSPLTYLLISDQMAPNHPEKINVPSLVIHGKNDDIVPYEFGVKLFESLNSPKDFWEIPRGGHIDGLNIAHFQKRLLFYIDKIKERGAKHP